MMLSKIFHCFDRLNGHSENDVNGVILEDVKDPQFGLHPLADPMLDPEDEPSGDLVDIIFVHGLGGSARKTWTHAQTKKFWPLWLYRHKRIKNVRLFTFAYDAGWERIWGPRNTLEIDDFAHQLLDCLELHIEHRGSNPIIFVAHSLGGLVVKKAIIDAFNSDLQRQVCQNVKGVIFIGTPHRGADLAKILKKILSFTFSKKLFVNQLSTNSEVVADINRLFYDRAKTMELASFYESTAVRALGIIVPRASAMLEGERSSALNGNHIQIVKYSSESDNNYCRVAERIALQVQKIRKKTIPNSPNSQYSRLSQTTEDSSKSHTAYAEQHPIASQIWMTPRERNRYFVGRRYQFETVHGIFPEAHKDHYRIAIWGLGGVGKTEFALEYLYLFRANYRYVFWISGVDRTTYISGLLKIGEEMKFTPKRQDMNSEEIASGLLNWLQQVDGWLLVIDNLDDMHVLDNLVPSGGVGSHVLITTRNSNLHELPAKTLEMSMLNEDEAVKLLLSRITSESAADDSISEVKMIVKELGYLPLAIEQAAGYIRISSKGISDFLSVYNSNRKRILNWQGPRSYPDSLAATWQLSFLKLREKDPKALELLNLFAFLNPDEVLVEFLEAGKDCKDEVVSHLLGDRFEFDTLLSRLVNCSLIGFSPQKRSITIHRLVQHVIKDNFSRQEITMWRTKALALCECAFPVIRQNDILVHRRFQSQVMPCITDPDLEDSELAADMLSRISWYLDCEAQYREAIPLWERVIEMYRRVLGNESPQVFINMDRLGWTLWHINNEKAVSCLEESFNSLKKVAGEENDDTLTCQRNLGVVLRGMGKKTEGMRHLEEACKTQQRVKGERNPRTQTTMRKLAFAYLEDGKLKDAELLFNAVLRNSKDDRRGNYQKTKCQLGWVYCLQERYDEGKEHLQNALAWQEENLGHHHPNTLTTSCYLGYALVQKGQLTEGTELLNNTHTKQKEVLGEEHKDTILTMGFLLEAYHQRSASRVGIT